jgi:hypothetical protein
MSSSVLSLHRLHEVITYREVMTVTPYACLSVCLSVCLPVCLKCDSTGRNSVRLIVQIYIYTKRYLENFISYLSIIAHILHEAKTGHCRFSQKKKRLIVEDMRT